MNEKRLHIEFWERIAELFAAVESQHSDSMYAVEFVLPKEPPFEWISPESDRFDRFMLDYVRSLDGQMDLRRYWRTLTPYFDGQHYWILVASSGTDDGWHAFCEAASLAIGHLQRHTNPEADPPKLASPICAWIGPKRSRRRSRASGLGRWRSIRSWMRSPPRCDPTAGIIPRSRSRSRCSSRTGSWWVLDRSRRRRIRRQRS